MDFSTEEKARYWNKNASVFYYSEILPLLNNIFDKHIPGDRCYFIERLEIDLGTVEEGELREAFLKGAEIELRRMLKGRSKNHFSKVTGIASEENDLTGEKVFIKESKGHLIENFYYFLDHGILPWNSDFRSVATLEAEIKQEIGLEKLVIHAGFQERMHRKTTRKRLYFQFSRLFWEDVCSLLYKPALTNLDPIRQDLASTLMLLAKSDSAQEKLRQELSEDIKVWIGATAPADTQDWPHHYVRWMVEKASPHVKPVGEIAILKAIMQELIMKDKGRQDTAALAIMLKAFISSADTSRETKTIQKQDRDVDTPNQMKPASAEGSKPEEGTKPELPETDSTKRFPKSKEKSVSAEKPSLSETQKLDKDTSQSELAAKESKTHPTHPNEKTLKETESIEPGDSQDSQLSETESTNAAAYPSEDIEQAEEKLPDHDSGNAEWNSKDSRQAWPLEKEEPEDKENIHPDYLTELKEYYLRYAGVILTWPYLTRLFQNADYLENTVFKDSQYQQRAVHLLAYIASGREQCEEPDLAMAKFLCAWPLQMPVMKDLVLTDKDKNKADQMLSSLIKNWAILKNTSLEGLRSSFFDREGKLFKEEQQWRMIVEQKSYDMLLDHLPYTVAIIKLPWMKDVLKVDWA